MELQHQNKKQVHHHKPFAEFRDIPLDIYVDLFTSVFKQPVFQEWYLRSCAWQLRVIGPPGSGKTTLAALTARSLRSSSRSSNVRVASIFLRNIVHTKEDELLVEILTSILRQLSGDTLDPQGLLSDFATVEKALQVCLDSIERPFVIIDDVDVCSPYLLDRLETILLMFSAHGLNVMITSRIPLHPNLSAMVSCDVDESHVDESIFWCCSSCHGQGETFNERDAFVICNACRNVNAVCPKCNTNAFLHEPYSFVNLFLKGLLASDEFVEFVIRALELSHGDIELDSKLKDKPPPSILGRNLTSVQAVRTVRRICDEASCNIAIAKLRLDLYQDARSINDLEKLGDRLPDNLLQTFDAAVERVMQQPEAERRLGIFSLVAAVVDDQDNPLKFGQPFRRLEVRLRTLGVLKPDLSGRKVPNIIRVLRATCGFLWIDNGHAMLVQPYHNLFGTYIKENYNDELYRTRKAMVTLLSASTSAKSAQTTLPLRNVNRQPAN